MLLDLRLFNKISRRVQLKTDTSKGVTEEGRGVPRTLIDHREWKQEASASLCAREVHSDRQSGPPWTRSAAATQLGGEQEEEGRIL